MLSNHLILCCFLTRPWIKSNLLTWHWNLRLDSSLLPTSLILTPFATLDKLSQSTSSLRRCSILVIIREIQISQSYKVTSQQSEWASSKCLHIINSGQGVQKRESSYTFRGNVNWYTHYGEQYGGYLKTKNRTTILSSNPTPGHISRLTHYSKWYKHPSVHCRAVYNS